MLKINNELIVNYEKLVYSIISKYSNETNKDDLFQVGMIGAITAYKKYNEKCGVKFTSFAYKYILGEVLKYLREDKNIRLSRDIISDYRKITIAKEKIYLNYGRQSSIEELSKVLNISKERILEVERLNEKEVSLNKIISDDEKITLEDTIYNIESVDRNDLINLNDALRSLSKKERKLIYERYYQNKTQTELAKEKNTSQVKIYRYERKVLDKLKDKML